MTFVSISIVDTIEDENMKLCTLSFVDRNE